MVYSIGLLKVNFSYWQTKVRSYCQHHARRPPLAASETTYIVQTVFTGQ